MQEGLEDKWPGKRKQRKKKQDDKEGPERELEDERPGRERKAGR